MYQLNPAPLDSIKTESSNNIYIKPNKQSNKSNGKTLKNRNVKFNDQQQINSNNSNKISNIADLHYKIDDDTEDNNLNYNNLNNNDNNDNNDNNNINNNQSNAGQNSLINQEMQKMLSMNDNNISNEQLLKSNSNSVFSNYNDSYRSNLEFITNMASNGNQLENNHKLLSKLDYIIHLLEEQQNEKTNYITEELILYLFLGIFIIFVLDSFARASKYVR